MEECLISAESHIWGDHNRVCIGVNQRTGGEGVSVRAVFEDGICPKVEKRTLNKSQNQHLIENKGILSPYARKKSFPASFLTDLARSFGDSPAKDIVSHSHQQLTFVA